jgi:hypothetical protein
MHDHPEGGYTNQVLVDIMKDIPEEDYIYVSIRMNERADDTVDWRSGRRILRTSNDGELRLESTTFKVIAESSSLTANLETTFAVSERYVTPHAR